MRSDYTILVTEPYPATRAFMTDALTAEGYRVACCAEPAVTVEEIGAVESMSTITCGVARMCSVRLDMNA